MSLPHWGGAEEHFASGRQIGHIDTPAPHRTPIKHWNGAGNIYHGNFRSTFAVEYADGLLSCPGAKGGKINDRSTYDSRAKVRLEDAEYRDTGVRGK